MLLSVLFVLFCRPHVSYFITSPLVSERPASCPGVYSPVLTYLLTRPTWVLLPCEESGTHAWSLHMLISLGLY